MGGAPVGFEPIWLGGPTEGARSTASPVAVNSVFGGCQMAERTAGDLKSLSDPCVAGVDAQKSGLFAVGTNASFFPAKNSNRFSGQAISGHAMAGHS
jgi:hypothetical protein